MIKSHLEDFPVASLLKRRYIHCTVNIVPEVNNASRTDRALPSVAETLQCLPQFTVEVHPPERLCVSTAHHSVVVRVVAHASGYPRNVRQAVWQAQECPAKDEKFLLYVPALSPGSRDWLQQQGVGYLDAQGNLFLTAEGIYILRDAAPHAVRSSVPVETNIFRGRATQVLASLLRTPERSWHVTDLAHESKVAAGTALRVCETLEKLLLMERQGRGPQSLRRLPVPGKLLDAWAEKHRLDALPIHRYYRWTPELDKLAGMIGAAAEEQGSAYAVTLGVGAARRAPFLTQVEQLALWLPECVEVERLAASCRLQRADEGPNVLLLGARDETPFLYRQQVNDLWIASDIQLYLDLLASPGRGREQAEHLRRERIGF